MGVRYLMRPEYKLYGAMTASLFTRVKVLCNFCKVLCNCFKYNIQKVFVVYNLSIYIIIIVDICYMKIYIINKYLEFIDIIL